jgi:hypothetical protein
MDAETVRAITNRAYRNLNLSSHKRGFVSKVPKAKAQYKTLAKAKNESKIILIDFISL